MCRLRRQSLGMAMEGLLSLLYSLSRQRVSWRLAFSHGGLCTIFNNPRCLGGGRFKGWRIHRGVFLTVFRALIFAPRQSKIEKAGPSTYSQRVGEWLWGYLINYLYAARRELLLPRLRKSVSNVSLPSPCGTCLLLSENSRP